MAEIISLTEKAKGCLYNWEYISRKILWQLDRASLKIRLDDFKIISPSQLWMKLGQIKRTTERVSLWQINNIMQENLWDIRQSLQKLITRAHVIEPTWHLEPTCSANSRKIAISKHHMKCLKLCLQLREELPLSNISQNWHYGTS